MDKIFELFLYTSFLFMLFSRILHITNKPFITLYLSLFLYNLIFEIIVAIYDKTAIKFDLIFHSMQQSFVAITLYAIINETLLSILEMSESIRMMIISFILGIVTKHFHKFYIFSRL